MSKTPRLQFTDQDRTAPKLRRSINRAEQAANRFDKAQKKIPTRTVIRRKAGEHDGHLHFEQTSQRKPTSKLQHTLRDAPANLASGSFHHEMRQDEDENVGVESFHKAEETGENSLRYLRDRHRNQKLKPFRRAAQAERKLDSANLSALYRKARADDPVAFSSPFSRWKQRQAIKLEYAAAKRNGGPVSASQTTSSARKAADAALARARQAEQFFLSHRRGILVAAALFLVMCFLLNTMSSCSMMVESVGSAVTGSTYPSRDEDMLGAEGAYAAMEAELQSYLDNYESTHDYDEYHFQLDEIVHDPYVLISILTAYHQGEWTLPQVQGTLSMLFDLQYILTENVVKEVHYRTEYRTDSTGNSYSVQVPYDYFICTVTLKNMDLSHLPVYIMGEDQVSMYAVYMATLGNRPDLFPRWQFPHASEHKDYLDYEVPPEALEDERFAAMLKEAEKYLGFPYVWGGTSPTTSFDCSGFVSWVLNHSGWDVGRQGVLGLNGLCKPASPNNAQPGDLIFFEDTYDAPLPGPTHVGIYVGNNMMIHCGDPISYTNINTSYWQQHFYGYGRLPEP